MEFAWWCFLYPTLNLPSMSSTLPLSRPDVGLHISTLADYLFLLAISAGFESQRLNTWLVGHLVGVRRTEGNFSKQNFWNMLPLLTAIFAPVSDLQPLSPPRITSVTICVLFASMDACCVLLGPPAPLGPPVSEPGSTCARPVGLDVRSRLMNSTFVCLFSLLTDGRRDPTYL